MVTAVICMLTVACNGEDIDGGAGLVTEAPLLYLQEEVPPCAPVSGSSRDPCARQSTPSLSPLVSVFYDEIPAYWDVYYAPDEPPSIFTPHVVVRASFLPDTTRCDFYARESPAFTNHSGRGIGLLLMCFVDARINDYLIGTGPPELTVAAYSYPFLYREGADTDWIEGHCVNVVGAYEGREGVLFLAPSPTTVVEAWRMIEFWDVQRTGDDMTVVAPYKETIEMLVQRGLIVEELKSEFTPEKLALLEVPLSDFEITISQGAAARAAETGGRIAVGDSLPMLITDANLLRPYYEGPGVGVVYETDAPVLPPPVPGGNEPGGPPADTC